MFDSGFFDSLRRGSEEEEKKEAVPPRLPPKSRHEWLDRLGRDGDHWPIRDPEMLLQPGGAEALLGDAEAIARDLQKHAREPT